MDYTQSFAEHLNFSAEHVARLCHPLFKSTPISHVDYDLYFDNGECCILSSSPSFSCEVVVEKMIPTAQEFEKYGKTALRTATLSHALALPAGADVIDLEKFGRNIELAMRHHIYHRLHFVDRFEGYTRLVGFGVQTESSSVFNFYMSYLDKIEHFIQYFEKKLYDLILEVKTDHLVKNPMFEGVCESTVNSISKGANDDANVFDQMTQALRPASASSLTPRERACLALIAKGYSMKRVGRELGISDRTVEQHLYSSRNKLCLDSKNQLIEYWHAYGGFL